jgi:outer membrane protein TolC
MKRLVFAFCLALCAHGQAPIENLTLPQALERARLYSQQFLTAATTAQIAHEDAVQAKAALLPTGSLVNGFTYTQPNGTDTGVFIANNGPREYINEAVVHADIWSPVKRADYRRAMAAEAAARARVDIAVRGLVTVVVQGYYGTLVGQRKVANAEQSLREAEQFLDITRKLQEGGEAARADVVKAQILYEQRRIDLQNAQLDLDKARIAFGVLIFPTYTQQFTVADDLETVTSLPALSEVEAMAHRANPDIRAAEATVSEQQYELTSSRAALYPSVSADYVYGLDANRFAYRNPEGFRQVGSAAAVQLNLPVFNWGATRSRIRQSELRLQQARNDLNFTQRQLAANLNSFHAEAQVASGQIDTLRRLLALAEDSLRLTQLRYQAGEATAQEVVDAQTTLAGARNGLSDGLLRLRVAIANLQTVTGAF